MHSYIHNLMPCNAAALMASASLHEAQPTRDLLCLHLTRREAISVRIPVRTYPGLFALSGVSLLPSQPRPLFVR